MRKIKKIDSGIFQNSIATSQEYCWSSSSRKRVADRFHDHLGRNNHKSKSQDEWDQALLITDLQKIVHGSVKILKKIYGQSISTASSNAPVEIQVFLYRVTRYSSKLVSTVTG